LLVWCGTGQASVDWATVTDQITYDAAGNRRTDNANTYTWDLNAPNAQLATESATSTDYLYGAGLISEKVGSTRYYYVKDNAGSVANVLAASGSGTAISKVAYTYDPWGGIRTQTGTTPTNPMQFDSEYRDSSTGNYNLRARMYDPGLGAFLSADPIGQAPDYTFAAGNPQMYSDPSGLSPIGDTLWELVHNPVASWTEGPSAPKWIGGVIVAVGAIGLVTACALATAGVCAGFTVLGFGNTAAGAGAGTTLCQELCDDAASVVIEAETAGAAPSRITGYTWHGLQRVIDRDGTGVSIKALLDAVRSPLNEPTWQLSGETWLYVGKHADVVLNQAGRLVTAWPTSAEGWRL
jgi:RHS repeat-associated protein